MRRTLTKVATGGVLATLLVAQTALGLGARPAHPASWHGAGKVCENNAPGRRYTDCFGNDRFSFRTSLSGQSIRSFSGQIGPFYCGGGTNTITYKSVAIRSDGSFAAHFTSANVVAGKKTGESRVVVRGRFTAARTAHLFYSLVTHFSGTSSSQDCGAQVTGVARAH